MDKCMICGRAHADCGPRTTVLPVDHQLETREDRNVSALKLYEVNVGSRRGGVTTTTMRLSEAEAKRVGAKPVGAKAKAPAAKAAAKPKDKAAPAPKDKAAGAADDKGAAPAAQAAAAADQ